MLLMVSTAYSNNPPTLQLEGDYIGVHNVECFVYEVTEKDELILIEHLITKKNYSIHLETGKNYIIEFRTKRLGNKSLYVDAQVSKKMNVSVDFNTLNHACLTYNKTKKNYKVEIMRYDED